MDKMLKGPLQRDLINCSEDLYTYQYLDISLLYNYVGNISMEYTLYNRYAKDTHI